MLFTWALCLSITPTPNQPKKSFRTWRIIQITHKSRSSRVSKLDLFAFKFGLLPLEGSDSLSAGLRSDRDSRRRIYTTVKPASAKIIKNALLVYYISFYWVKFEHYFLMSAFIWKKRNVLKETEWKLLSVSSGWIWIGIFCGYKIKGNN